MSSGWLLLLLLALNLGAATGAGSASASASGPRPASGPTSGAPSPALELPHGPGGVAILIRGQSYRAHPGTTRATCHPLARRAQNRTALSLINNVVAPLERAGNVVRFFVTDCQEPKRHRCEFVEELLDLYRGRGTNRDRARLRELFHDVECRTVRDRDRDRDRGLGRDSGFSRPHPPHPPRLAGHHAHHAHHSQSSTAADGTPPPQPPLPPPPPPSPPSLPGLTRREPARDDEPV